MSSHYHSYIILENSKNKRIGLNRSITQPIILSHPLQKFSILSQFHAILQYLYISIQPFWILEVLQPHTMT